MSARIKWVDRKFDFTFPVDIYPELIERLRGTPARVAERISELPVQLLTRRDGAAWSIQEHAGHLADLDESLFMARLDDYDAGASALRPADMTNRLTEGANHNARPVEAVLATLRAARGAVITRLEALEPAAFARQALHPRLQCPMRVVDMMFFHAEHDDYHLARITELSRAGVPLR
jgi:hypothetical protein